jgi:predicted nicotinamide N-methyase
MPDAPPVALRPVPVPSAGLLARLAPLTPVSGRPDLVAHHAPDVCALWQAWEEECGTRQAVPFWATVWPAAQLLAHVFQAEPAWGFCRNFPLRRSAVCSPFMNNGVS